MEADTTRPTVHESATVESVDIPIDILEELDNLEIVGRKKPWEPWMDEVLREYWETRRQEEVAEVIGVGVKRCRKRARELGL